MKISSILTELGKDGVYSTDKNRDRKHTHCYGLAYDHIFKSFDRKSKLDILEVGVEWGASLEAWRRFFPSANIEGVDIVDRVENKLAGVKYITKDIAEFKPKKKYDIVIDDGSHKLSHVIKTIENIKLKVGGVMIIEDCKAPAHWLKKILKTTKHSVELIDLRKVNNQHDDCLIVLRNYGYNL